VTSTAKLLYEKATEKSCGDSCVEWAIARLIEGRDGENLRRLAAMIPPHNHFEVAALRDRALTELHISTLDREEAILDFAHEIISKVALGETDELIGAAIVANLCVEADYSREVMDFYLLYYAATDLDYDDVQYYWDGATRENIRQLIRDRAIAHTGDASNS
jgi:hypothetical protein